MGRGLLLWLIGIPLPIILLLYRLLQLTVLTSQKPVTRGAS